MKRLLIGVLLGGSLLGGCAGEARRDMAAGLYDVTPEQCAEIQNSYMSALAGLEAEAEELDRLSCQMNKCAALEHLENGGGSDGHRAQVTERTRFAYAPAALGGQSCS